MPNPLSQALLLPSQRDERLLDRIRYGQGLMAEGSSTAPVQHWAQGLARALQGGLGGYFAGQAEREGKEKDLAYTQKLAAALRGEDPIKALAESDDPGLQGFALQHQLAQAMEPESRPDMVEVWDPAANNGQGAMVYMPETEVQGRIAKAPEPEKAPFPGAIKDDTGNWVYDPDYLSGQEQLRKAGRATTTVNVGGESGADAAQRKKLSEKEGERWSSLQESGTVAAGLAQDFQVLDELLTVAPQGPIQGRLAEAFQGFSSAGDAFQSVVGRVAPSLRTPGSGATSDIEYEGMLKSLPRLSNTPDGNRVIADTMKAKAALNIERAEIVTAFQNEEISAAEARRALSEINNRSILTPELKRSLGVVTGGNGGGVSGVVDELPPGFE